MASPAIRRRRLAAALRAITEGTGKTADQVARALGWSPSKMTRYELARTGLRLPDVVRLLDYYGIAGDRRDELLQLAQDAAGKGWWEASRDELPADFQLYIGFEDEAASLAIWHHDLVPGLLQSGPYARHIIANYGVIEPMPPRLIERLVQVRMRRQHVLTRETPVRLSAVLDESILYRRIGDEHVMHDQLSHLAALADWPNITIRVLPLGAQHMVIGPAFVICQFDSPAGAPLPDLVGSEHLTSIVFVADKKEAYVHRLAFQALETDSLKPAESRALILDTAAARWPKP